MFIKLTKMDGSPVWLNANFIVTVEPRRGGGSVVVPIGDGFDYDVKENPARVLEMLGESPVAKAEPPAPEIIEAVKAVAERAPEPAAPVAGADVPQAAAAEAPAAVETPAAAEASVPSDAPAAEVPVIAISPMSDGLTSMPDDLSPEGPSGEAPSDGVAEPKPAKRTRGRTKKTADGAAKPAKKAAKAETPAPGAKRPEDLSDDEIGRLRKLAPRTMKKLANTLSAQFGVADAEGAVRILAARDLLQVEQERVIWK